MKTVNAKTWSVEMNINNLFGNPLSPFTMANSKTYMVYEPQLPYLYIPPSDFETFATAVGTNANIVATCDTTEGTCVYDNGKSCDAVKAGINPLTGFSTELKDADGVAFTMNQNF